MTFTTVATTNIVSDLFLNPTTNTAATIVTTTLGQQQHFWHFWGSLEDRGGKVWFGWSVV